MPDEAFQFIDAHIHFYDLAHPTLTYSWLQPEFVHPTIGDIDGIKTLRYTYQNYVAETRFSGVVGAVHVQAALDSVDPAEESTFVNDQLDAAMPVMLVGDARMQSPDVEATLERHAAARELPRHPRLRQGRLPRRSRLPPRLRLAREVRHVLRPRRHVGEPRQGP